MAREPAGRAGKKVARLLAVNPASPASREFRLVKDESLIGSSQPSDLLIPDPTVSRRHAKIICHRGIYELVDLGSRNGSFVNGRRVAEPMRIGPGAELRFGNSRFVFSLAPVGGRGKGPRGRPSGLRLAGEVLLAAFVVGFAATQYWLYRLYRTENVRAARPRAIPLVPKAEVRAGSSGGKFASAPPPASPASAPLSASPASAPPSVYSWPAPQPLVSSGSTAPPVSPAWLARVNHYRALAGVPLVTANPALSQGDWAHARYIVKNFRAGIKRGVNLGAVMHQEDPSNPWYSPEGLAAARASDVDQRYGPKATASGFWAIDNWMSAPFHRLSILNPRLREVGYGSYCEAGVCAAALNTETDAAALPFGGMLYGKPVEYPPDGGVINTRSFQGEWPDPLSACPGFKSPAGLAITVQLGAWITPRLSGFTLSHDGVAVPACGFDTFTYSNPAAEAQALGRTIFKDYGAIALIPGRPLRRGRYVVSMVAQGRTYTWSFDIR